MAKYLYNGVELPALPEWDATTFPYATIMPTTSGFYSVRFTAATVFYNNSVGNISINDIDADLRYIYYEFNGSEWVGDGTVKELSIAFTSSSGATWSNYDILNEDGSVYLAASDPVPVTPTPADLFVKKGGKVYKVKGGSAQSIMTFDSVDEMNATEAPDGTIALVPSEGESGGGLPVVELETTVTSEQTILSDSDSSIIGQIGHNVFVLKATAYDAGNIPLVLNMNTIDYGVLVEGGIMYSGNTIVNDWLYCVSISNIAGSWDVLYFKYSLASLA